MQDVRKDREKYIGGSDVPAIMGISPFKTRWQLLQEKAQLIKNDFEGNYYTEYGNILEPQIREYINTATNSNLIEDKVIDGDVRYHADGHDTEKGTLLEIKTTSHIHDSLSDYKLYLVQLLFGMHYYNVQDGILAVYERNDSMEFNPLYLTLFNVKLSEWQELLDKILSDVEKFRQDLKRLREDPTLTEQDFLPLELSTQAFAIASLESQLAAMKEVEKQLKDAKAELKAAMVKYGVKSWTTPDGYKVTLVLDSPDTTVTVFDEDRYKLEHTDEYYLYQKEVIKKGRTGYVKVTVPKGGK